MYPSHAETTAEMSPLLTIQDFEDFASATRELTGARFVAYCPLIWDDLTRMAWEGYSVAEQSWMERYAHNAVLEPISPRIWLRDGNDDGLVDPGPAPYAPLWQVSPVPVTDTSMINFNMASDPRVEEWMMTQLEQNTSWSFLSQPDYRFLWSSSALPSGEEAGPTSLAWIPILERSDSAIPDSALDEEEGPQVSGALVADMPWTALLRNVSVMKQSGMVISFCCKRV